MEYPTGGHAIVVTNQTWYVDQPNSGIDVFVTGRFSNGYATVITRLDYFESLSIYVLVNESYTITYIIPDKKEAGLVGDTVNYLLIYRERICIYPEDDIVYIDSPTYLSEFDWVTNPEEQKEIKEKYYPRVSK